ncbi:MAG: hypothetical protein Fur0037_11730 [Planctomycetota bacterium]
MKAFLSALGLCGAIAAQAANEPHIGYVYPAGVQAGTSIEVTIGGKDLRSATAVEFSGKGLSGEITGYFRPMTPKERNLAREAVQKLLQKRRQQQLTKEEERQLEDLRKKLATSPRKQLNPQIAETVTVRITASPGAPPSLQEIRLMTVSGLSNPLRFEVGAFREHLEAEPNDKQADSGGALPFPVVLNGQIMPGDVDRFLVRAKKGMHLVAKVEARSLIPYLADAVPGWFQATLAVYDENGREIAYDDDDRFLPDPRISFTVPRSGDYSIEIKDSIYRGREDFVYRISVGELPAVSAVFPLGARRNEPTLVTLRGVNVPEPHEIKIGEEGIHEIRIEDDPALTDAIPFEVGTLREQDEHEPNDEEADRVRFPIVVNGCIDRPGDVDLFEFSGNPGETVVAEIEARRLNSCLDSLLILLDPSGAEVARYDDCVDPGAGLLTHHADSRLEVKLTRHGLHRLVVRDLQGKGGPGYGYRLRVSRPMPDFDLRVVPSAINLPAGETGVFTVHALRRDGFDGEIDLALVDPLPGFVLGGGLVPKGADRVMVTLTAPLDPLPTPVRLRLEGTARIGGTKVVRQATPADDVMQAFIYRHLVPAQEWLCSVLRSRGATRLLLANDKRIRLPVGHAADVRIFGPRRKPLPRGIEFVIREPPPGIEIARSSLDEKGLVLRFKADSKTAEKGTTGNLIVDVFLERTVQSRNKGQKPRQVRSRIGTLPAIPFQIIGG